MTAERHSTTGFMTPWCEIAVLGDETVLFGFAVQHPRTGGLAWTRSSRIVYMSSDRKLARTASGTQWALGRSVLMQTVSQLGSEARLAFTLLFEPDGLEVGMLHVPALAVDRQTGEKWLTACKMSRHLGVTPPEPTSVEIDAFLLRHGPAYVKVRQGT